MAALEAADWRIYEPGGAAALLGIKPTTLALRLRTMKIRKLRG
jgi:transcriptional regulator with GAF, ATPase, and Fis domain